MIVTESPLRDLARLIIWYPVRWLIQCLPVTISFRLFGLLGLIHKRLRSKSLNAVRANMERASLRTDRVNTALDAYIENHYIDRLHIFTYPKLHRSQSIEKVCSLKGIDNLETALEKGCGAIIVLGHSGPIQLPLFNLGKAGYDVIQVGLPTDEGLSWIGRNVAFRLRMKYEAMIPVQILAANKFLRPLFTHLKRKQGVVMMNIDPAGGGRWIGPMTRQPFFGHKIPFPLGSALLSAKTGAPILPLSIVRAADGRWLCTIHPSLGAVKSGCEETFVAEMATWYEQIIRQQPGLWHFWDEFEPGKLVDQGLS